MRIIPLFQAACLSLMLSACVAPLLLMSPTSQLMWALLKPMVGFDPNDANLFEQPLIKDKMTAMLGPNYDSTMQLLKTANELQQEGPLFYVVSRYAPVPEVAKQAGMVWNADTNLLSVMLQKGDGATQVFGENLATATPTWPSEMQEWQANPTATALSGVSKALSGSPTALLGDMVGGMQQSATRAVTDSAAQAVTTTTGAVQQQAGKTLADPAKQTVSNVTTTAQQQAGKAVADPAKQTVSNVTTTAQQQASKAVADSASQAVSGATDTVLQQADKTLAAPAKQAATATQAEESKVESTPQQIEQVRADAEAELEKLLN